MGKTSLQRLSLSPGVRLLSNLVQLLRVWFTGQATELNPIPTPQQFCDFGKSLPHGLVKQIRQDNVCKMLNVFPGTYEHCCVSCCQYSHYYCYRVALVALMVKNMPAIQQTPVQSLGREYPLEKGMGTHSSILAWKIQRTEEPGGLQSMGSQSQIQLRS